MLSSDIGSIPDRKDSLLIWNGAKKTNSLLPLLGVSNEEYEVFKEEITTAFIDKLNSGVDVPNYPQFRDMNEMFLMLMNGIKKSEQGLIAVKRIKAKHNASIPEIKVLKQESKRIKEDSGHEKIRVKICITGPYTLSSFFQVKTSRLYEELGQSLADILANSIFSNKYAKICHVSIDEPVLGFINDPLLDYGSDGRESLRKAWELIAGTATRRGIETSMHLHNTSENLFWEVLHLNTIASHVDDPLYSSELTKQKLEEMDKKLWASIGITQFDTLIQNTYLLRGFDGNIPEMIGKVWTEIKKGKINPYIFLEKPSLLKKRLQKISDYFGIDRISFSSPECGLDSFPEYDIAIECLRRTSKVISEFN